VRTDRDHAVVEVDVTWLQSESTIYDWIRRGTLQARRGPGGRLWVQFGSDIEQECRERTANSGHITAKTKER
jgi:hypothetical protein